MSRREMKEGWRKGAQARASTPLEGSWREEVLPLKTAVEALVEAVVEDAVESAVDLFSRSMLLLTVVRFCRRLCTFTYASLRRKEKPIRPGSHPHR